MSEREMRHDAPRSAMARLRLAEQLRARGDAVAAAAACRRALALAPLSAPAWTTLQALLDAAGDCGAAACDGMAMQALLAQVAGADGGDPPPTTADIAWAADQALRRHPGDAALWRERAEAARRAGLARMAATAYRRWLALAPGAPEPHHMAAAGAAAAAPAAPPPGYVRVLFDGYADRFDDQLRCRLAYRVPEHMALALARVAPRRRFGRVLDLGCGTGLAGAALRGRTAFLAGVDLSPAMIERARQRAVYDRLDVADAVAALAAEPGAWDLVAAADMVIYLGDLAPLLDALAAALAPAGLAALSTEAAAPDETDGFVLRPTGRYAHAPAYVTGLATRAGLRPTLAQPITLREEARQPVAGHLFVLEKA